MLPRVGQSETTRFPVTRLQSMAFCRTGSDFAASGSSMAGGTAMHCATTSSAAAGERGRIGRQRILSSHSSTWHWAPWCANLAKIQRQIGPFQGLQGKDRHACTAAEVDLLWASQPTGEEVRRPLVGHGREIAAAKQGLAAAFVDAMAGQAADRVDQQLALGRARLGSRLGLLGDLLLVLISAAQVGRRRRPAFLLLA